MKSRQIWVLGFVLVVFNLVAMGAGQSPADVEKQVNDLLSKMTVAEKVSMISGYKVYRSPGIPRLGIPEIKMMDGPIGTRNDGQSTAYPGEICLAASWDTDLAQQFGVAEARDGRARGAHIILGPAMNIYRVPMDGRNSEYMGEDPYLTGNIAGSVILGVQSQGVVATMKHYACNNQEDHRMTVSAEVDERTLREIYLRVFQIAMEKGHPWAVMCAYNKINDVYCSANHWLLTDVMKNEWGFPGLIMSDWGAVHETLGPLNAGLDLEMPGQKWLIPSLVMPLIKSGQVSEATIDDKVRRILRVEVSMGFVGEDVDQQDATIALDDPANRQTALQIAREGIVLLKNDGNLLPLNKSKTKTIAIIGPNADPAITGIGGSSYTQPFRPVSTLKGIRKAAGDAVNIAYIPASEKSEIQELMAKSVYQANDPSTVGLTAEFFSGKDLSGKPVLTRQDQSIDFKCGGQNPAPAGLKNNDFSARWSGKIVPQSDGTYVFSLASHEGSRMFLDGKQIIDLWSGHDTRQVNARLDLKGGKTYDLRVEFFSGWRSSSVQFGWGPARPLMTPEEENTIEHADAAILCVGFDPSIETEGRDRPYELPTEQVQLIQKVERMNPRTVVILNAGGNVEMASWIDKTAALVQAWYPGEEGGNAIADILFGNFDPSGRLPATFEKRLEDTPAYGNYPGADDKVYYKEGMLVGYRWYDAKGIEPRFPFGYGLSYTTFQLSDLKVNDSKNKPGAMDVTVKVKNTGKRSGADVIQLYVGQDHPTLPTPPRKLAGFARVDLKPGQKKTVHFTVDGSTIAYWHPDTKQWQTDEGGYHVWVGESSRDLPLSQGIEWTARK